MKTTSKAHDAKLREIQTYALYLRNALWQLEWRVSAAVRTEGYAFPMTSESIELALLRIDPLTRKLHDGLEELYRAVVMPEKKTA